MATTTSSSSAFRSPYADLVPSGLMTAIQYHPNRWHVWTINAALGVPDAQNRSPQAWTALLDQIEERLAEIVTA